jgi:hypothetical protein
MSFYDKKNKSVSEAVKNILESSDSKQENLQEYESKGGSYKHTGKYGSEYKEGERHDPRGDKAASARGPVATTKTTTTTPGHSDSAARLRAIQVKGAPGNKQIKGKAQSGSAESKNESNDQEQELIEMEDTIDNLIKEYESKGGSYKHKGKYGSEYKEGERHDPRGDKASGARGPVATTKTTTTTPGHSDSAARFRAIQVKGSPGGKVVKGKAQSGSADSKNESVETPSFSNLISKYYNDGLASLSESFVLKEEPTNKEFHAEVQDQKEKFEGKKKGADVAAPSTVGTKEIKEEVLTEGKRLISKHGEGQGEHTAKVYKDTEYNEYQVHFFKNGKHMGEGPVSYHGDDKDDAQKTAESALKRLNKAHMKEEVEQLDEGKELTADEMKAREKVVKGMKKNLASFKARYGDRAKGVMYATATKMVNK